MEEQLDIMLMTQLIVKFFTTVKTAQSILGFVLRVSIHTYMSYFSQFHAEFDNLKLFFFIMLHLMYDKLNIFCVHVPIGAVFHQVHLICMPPSDENICQQSQKYHFVNDYLYKPINMEEHQTKPNISLR